MVYFNSPASASGSELILSTSTWSCLTATFQTLDEALEKPTHLFYSLQGSSCRATTTLATTSTASLAPITKTLTATCRFQASTDTDHAVNVDEALDKSTHLLYSLQGSRRRATTTLATTSTASLAPITKTLTATCRFKASTDTDHAVNVDEALDKSTHLLYSLQGSSCRATTTLATTSTASLAPITKTLTATCPFQASTDTDHAVNVDEALDKSTHLLYSLQGSSCRATTTLATTSTASLAPITKTLTATCRFQASTDTDHAGNVDEALDKSTHLLYSLQGSSCRATTTLATTSTASLAPITKTLTATCRFQASTDTDHAVNVDEALDKSTHLLYSLQGSSCRATTTLATTSTASLAPITKTLTVVKAMNPCKGKIER